MLEKDEVTCFSPYFRANRHLPPSALKRQWVELDLPFTLLSNKSGVVILLAWGETDLLKTW